MKHLSPAERAAPLERYEALVRRFHGTLDLMSDAGLEHFDDHVADALVYADVIAALSPAPRQALDVGSGVGLPGVVLAAALPDLAVELVERRRKRVAFLRMAVASVGRSDVVVHEGDVRSSSGPEVDVVTAQAVGRLADVYALVAHRCGEGVVLLARKGPGWRDELSELEERIAASRRGGAIEAAERPSATAVLAERPLSRRGTLVAVRVLR